MAVFSQISLCGPRGTITPPAGKIPGKKRERSRSQIPSLRARQPQQHLSRVTWFPAELEYQVFCLPLSLPGYSEFKTNIRKLASKENTKRVLGLVFSPFSSNNRPPAGSPTPSLYTNLTNQSLIRPEQVSNSALSSSNAEFEGTTPAAQAAILSQSLPGEGSSADLSLMNLERMNSSIDLTRLKRPANAVQQVPTAGEPIASGTGISCSIHLAEPYVYLHGFDQNARTEYSTSMIRGKMVLNVTKGVKIKSVTLIFSGKARTEWPEGIPLDLSRYCDEEKLRYQVLPFYNALYNNPDGGYGAQCVFTLRNDPSTNLSILKSDSPSALSPRSSRSSTILSAMEIKRLSIGSVQPCSFHKSDIDVSMTDQQKGYKMFPPGVYEYSFEISLDNTCPETAELPYGSVRWKLEALVERAGVLKPNLHGCKDVLVVRAPDQNSLEQTEPIAISRKWEDQLYYDIVISGKSFAIGSKIPITFKLTPLAKVQCHRIKVILTENIDYTCPGRGVTRKDSQRKILLLERHAGKELAKEFESSEMRVTSGGELPEQERARARAMAQHLREQVAEREQRLVGPLPPPRENLLGDLDLGLDHLVSQTEIEMNIQLPTCAEMRRDETKMIHPNTTWKNVQVHHWIKVILRLSRVDSNDPTGTRRRHFEISIDSPFHILSCLATQAYTTLPEYTDLCASRSSQIFECGCPNAAVTSDMSPTSSSGSVTTLGALLDQGSGLEGSSVPEITPPQQARYITSSTDVVQPTHMLRNPSCDPPPFDEDEPPPPAATPPPVYDHLFGTQSQNCLADCSQRLTNAYSDDDHTDGEESPRYTSRTGRVNVANPRTPGGMVASRSMDINRDFMFRPEESGMLRPWPQPQPQPRPSDSFLNP